MFELTESLQLEADVLVIGGGPAACWAAWSAVTQGAKTVLVDKGYVGASGAAAAAGNSLLNPPPENREALVRRRYESGTYLADPRWMEHVLEATWRSLPLVESWGYRFPQENGEPARESFWGPEYLRVLRVNLLRVGVHILDQSPALELLLDENGVVAGARGFQRQEGCSWTVRAKAVIIAAGGNAFLSKVLGCNTNTGDGLLMAAEAGSELQGMEYSGQYAISSALNATVTRGVPFRWASFMDAEGKSLGDRRAEGDDFARALLKGPVYAQMDQSRPEVKRVVESSHYITFYPLEKAGVDPYTQRFEVTLVLEGTVRGLGGIRLLDEDCHTLVPGLFAAGDSASRVNMGGAATIGGGPSAAWCIATGQWSGRSAAAYARQLGEKAHQRTVRPAGQAGLRSREGVGGYFDTDEIIQTVQKEVIPLHKNYFRSESGLLLSLEKLDRAWEQLKAAPRLENGRDIQRAREAAAMTATARWMYRSALERKESRGSHRRTDFPKTDYSQRFHLTTGGLDQVWVWKHDLPPVTGYPTAPAAAEVKA